MTIETIQANLNTVYHNYKAVKSQAASLRDTFLECLTTAQAEDQGLNATTHLKTIWEREWQHLTFWCIHAIINPKWQYGGLTMVVTSDGTKCHSKSSVKQAENQARFNQASDTPPLQAPLYGLLAP